MNKHFILNILVLFFYGYFLYSQNIHLDSLKQKLEQDSARIFKTKKYLPGLVFDSRNSIISSAPINIIGLQIGLILKERDMVGIGGYKIYLPFKINEGSSLYKLRVAYFTLFYSFLIIDKRYYEIDLMGEIGAGRFNVHRITNNNEIFIKAGRFNPFGLSAVFTLKVLKWLGIQTMFGYRWMLQKEFYNTFSGPFYSIGIWFSTKDFIRFIRYNCIAKTRYKKQVKK